MKHLFTLVLLILAFFTNDIYAQIATWNSTTGISGTGATAGTATLGAGLVATNVTACGNKVFTTTDIFDTGDPSPTDYANAVADNEYIEFPITASTGYTLTVNQVSFSGQKSNTGGNNTGISNGTTLINDITWSPASCGTRTITISPAVVINSGETIDFRLYVWGATATNGSWRVGSVVFSGTALPVEFSYFEVKNRDLRSQLSFSTASETNNDFFTIERSADGRSFDAIGEIKGAGNSNTALTYEYTDEKPYAGINFYRIKQTDYDGKYSYSDIKSVRHNTIGALNITPRTTEGRLQVTTDIEAYSLDVYNVAGQQVKSFKSLSQDQYIYIDDLTAGLYFIRINHSGQVETTKIVKI